MCVTTDWIVAVSAISGTVIAGFSLAYLVKYVAATRRQVEVSQDQLEATMRPILIVTVENAGEISIGIRNVSNVPALNVSYQIYGQPDSPQKHKIPVLVQPTCLNGGSLTRFVLCKDLLGESKHFEVEYESASGQCYRTTGKWDKELELTLAIQKLGHHAVTSGNS